INLFEQKFDLLVLKKLKLPDINIQLDKWTDFVSKIKNPAGAVNIAVCGKYTDYLDAYKSITESFIHAGAENDVKVSVKYISAEDFTKRKPENLLKGMDGVLVPGGFGERGIEGKLVAIQYVRENKIPFLGICLGMQCAVIEFSRNILGIKKANSAEFVKNQFSVIHIMPDQKNIKNKGGTMRLGAYPCIVSKGTKTKSAYKKEKISERHRHRYEVNNKYREDLEKNGMLISGISPDGNLVEILELEDHPWFVGCQFHPELKSRATNAHPLFRDFVKAAVSYAQTKGEN
ncbi:MAG: CTP synthase, partial [Ignavibacteriae bacterium]|nr:CTP synthase [Ignavibacteriota bacterium]